SDSMRQAQALAMRDVLSWLPQVLVMNPHLRAEETLRWIGDVGDTPGLDRLLDLNVLQMLRSLALQTQLPQPGPAPEPRLLNDRAPQPLFGLGTNRPAAAQSAFPALGA